MPRRRFARLLVGLAVCAALLAGTGKLLLASDFATRQVLARLQAVVGAPLRIREVDLGYTTSSLRDVDVIEKLPTADPPAWSSARSVEADVSLWQLLRG